MKRAAAIGAYLATLLAVDTRVGYGGQLALGVLTWAALGAVLTRLPIERRVQTLGVVAFATAGEVTGSLVWGVYSYRLHNLPLFIPPAHGLVFVAGLSLAAALRERWIVWTAGAGAVGWGLLGLTVLPRLDVAGAIGVPLLCAFLWRSRTRGTYAAVFLASCSLPLFPCFAIKGRLQTTAFHREREEDWFTWPIWRHPISLDVLRSLLAYHLTSKSRRKRHSAEREQRRQRVRRTLVVAQPGP